MHGALANDELSGYRETPAAAVNVFLGVIQRFQTDSGHALARYTDSCKLRLHDVRKQEVVNSDNRDIAWNGVSHAMKASDHAKCG